MPASSPYPQSTSGGTAASTVALDTATLAALETINVGNFPATQAVSAAALPLPAGAATETTLATVNTNLTGHAQTFKPVTPITAISGANATATLTIPAAGAGLFAYITRIVIRNINPAATAIAGSAVTLAYTSTNIPGALAWTAGNALAAGAEKVVTDEVLSQPIKTTTANTATTIVAPAIGAGGLCRITAYYYTGP